MTQSTNKITFIDSHTEGEPTRVITGGAPDLPGGTVKQQLQVLKQHDDFRKTVILEPRGWDALVGAVLCQSEHPDCVAGVIFINNAGYLGMCGHGTIGLAVTLFQMGRIGLGIHKVETPVGIVEFDLQSANRAAIANVPSYRTQKQVSVDVPGIGLIQGDVAWGGNWFFLVDWTQCPLDMNHLKELDQACAAIREALTLQGITGQDGAEIDHVELFVAGTGSAHSKNYVYCPGGAYDRSPCGTGTSAKLACLAADGKWPPGQPWIQESIIGSRFEASYQPGPDNTILPTIVGSAYVSCEGTLIQHSDDPFARGIC